MTAVRHLWIYFDNRDERVCSRCGLVNSSLTLFDMDCLIFREDGGAMTPYQRSDPTSRR